MDRKFISLVATPLVCGWAVVASAQDKAVSPSLAVSITGMTLETFEALAPDAMLEVKGERITKSEFIERRQSAIKETIRKIQERQAGTETEFQAHRKAFLDSQAAKLKEANAKAQTEADRLIATHAAAAK
jgi:hypothetical protein